MTANSGGRPVGETDITTTRRPRSVARDQSGQHQEDVIHLERTMLTHLGADDISMWVLRKDNLDDGRLLRIDAARVETFGRRSAGSIAARIAQRAVTAVRASSHRPGRAAHLPPRESSPRVGYEPARRDAGTNAGTALADGGRRPGRDLAPGDHPAQRQARVLEIGRAS